MVTNTERVHMSVPESDPSMPAYKARHRAQRQTKLTVTPAVCAALVAAAAVPAFAASGQILPRSTGPAVVAPPDAAQADPGIYGIEAFAAPTPEPTSTSALTAEPNHAVAAPAPDLTERQTPAATASPSASAIPDLVTPEPVVTAVPGPVVSEPAPTAAPEPSPSATQSVLAPSAQPSPVSTVAPVAEAIAARKAVPDEIVTPKPVASKTHRVDGGPDLSADASGVFTVDMLDPEMIRLMSMVDRWLVKTAASQPSPSASVAVVAPAASTNDPAPSVGVTGIVAIPKPAPEPEPLYDTEAFFSQGSRFGLTDNGKRVYSAVRSAFGDFIFGGFRACPEEAVCYDPDGHPSGKALDVMNSDVEKGNEIAAMLATNAEDLNVKYIIWRQRVWYRGAPNADDPTLWSLMADRGSITENHYDHVHVSVW